MGERGMGLVLHYILGVAVEAEEVETGARPEAVAARACVFETDTGF